MRLSPEVSGPSLEPEARAPNYRAIYVHVPFCRRVCAYCDFAVTASHRSDPRQLAYSAALKREIEELPDGIRPISIFFGGGTPSTLIPDRLAEAVDALRSKVDLSRIREMSIECNPEDIDDSSAREITRIGFDRVSLGVQTLSDPGRKILTRRHSAAAVKASIESLRDAGIRHVCVDLILAWPGQTREILERDVDSLAHWGVDHVSCYVLTYEPGTPLTRGRSMGVIRPAAESLELDLLRVARDRLTDHGFQRYEISNYARPGHRCVHNQVYWRREPYLGLGPSAASYTGTQRFRNAPKFEDWADALLRGRSPRIDVETLDARQHFLEFLMLSLRTTKGLSLRTLERFKLLDRTLIENRRLEEYLRSGLIERTRNSLRATDRGIELADELACGLAAHDHPTRR